MMTNGVLQAKYNVPFVASQGTVLPSAYSGNKQCKVLIEKFNCLSDS